MRAAAAQAETADLTAVGRCHVGNDAADHDVLYRPAVVTHHGGDVLLKEAAAFIDLGLVSACRATVFQFPSHRIAASARRGLDDLDALLLAKLDAHLLELELLDLA